MSRLLRIYSICATLLPLQLLAQAAPTHAFAAPQVAASLPAGSVGGIGKVTLALLLVLLAVFAVAFVLRKLRGFNRGGSADIEVVAQVALGTRERAMIVKVGESRLLLGVAPGRISMLHVLPADTQVPEIAISTGGAVARPTFASLLKKSMGL
ncbi:MAG: flagellar biosynthetic protein FliO [Pseudomonadota bacterium]